MSKALRNIDPDRDYTVAELCELLPQKPHAETVRKWTKRGVNGRILESYKLGGTRLITGEALLNFLEPGVSEPRLAEEPTVAERQREAAAACRELERLGA